MNQKATGVQAAPELLKYYLTSGKHSHMNADGERISLRAGDEVLLSANEVKKHPNKFALVTVPDVEGAPVVAPVEVPDGGPAAPTVADMEADIEGLPEVPGAEDQEFESADEAIQALRVKYGELLHDGYAEQIVGVFNGIAEAAKQAKAAEDAAEAAKAAVAPAAKPATAATKK